MSPRSFYQRVVVTCLILAAVQVGAATYFGAPVCTGSIRALDDGLSASRFVAQTSFTATKMATYIVTASSGTFAMALYADTTTAGGSQPGIKLAQTSEIAGPKTGWNSADLSAPVAMDSGTAYWLVFNTNDQYIAFGANEAPQQTGWVVPSDYGVWPDTFPVVNPASDDWRGYGQILASDSLIPDTLGAHSDTSSVGGDTDPDDPGTDPGTDPDDPGTDPDDPGTDPDDDLRANGAARSALCASIRITGGILSIGAGPYRIEVVAPSGRVVAVRTGSQSAGIALDKRLSGSSGLFFVRVSSKGQSTTLPHIFRYCRDHLPAFQAVSTPATAIFFRRGW